MAFSDSLLAYGSASDFMRKRQAVPRAHLHNFGLGDATRTVRGVRIDGQSTFTLKDGGKSAVNCNFAGGDQAGCRGGVKEDLSIKSLVDAWRETGAAVTGHIDLIHVNCEGCEWEMLRELVRSGLAAKVQVVQFGTHFFHEISDIGRKYCEIDSGLSKTHSAAFQQPFGWERWVLKPELKSGVHGGPDAR